MAAGHMAMRDFWRLAAAVGAVVVLTVGGVNVPVGDPLPRDIEGRIRAWLRAGVAARAEQELEKLVERDVGDVHVHCRWTTLHFSRPLLDRGAHRGPSAAAGTGDG